MTVAELIEKLSEFPPNYTMHSYDSELGEYRVIYDADYNIGLHKGILVYA